MYFAQNRKLKFLPIIWFIIKRTCVHCTAKRTRTRQIRTLFTAMLIIIMASIQVGLCRSTHSTTHVHSIINWKLSLWYYYYNLIYNWTNMRVQLTHVYTTITPSVNNNARASSMHCSAVQFQLMFVCSIIFIIYSKSSLQIHGNLRMLSSFPVAWVG